MNHKRMKHFFSIMVLLSGLPFTTAQAQQSMVVYSTYGSEAGRYALTNTIKITFGNGNMMIGDIGTPSESIGLEQVGCIKFVDPTSIQGVLTNSTKLDVKLKGDVIMVEGLTKEACDASIVSINGALVMHLDHFNGQPIHVGSLPRGIYILRIKNYSFKFVK